MGQLILMEAGHFQSDVVGLLPPLFWNSEIKNERIPHSASVHNLFRASLPFIVSCHAWVTSHQGRRERIKKITRYLQPPESLLPVASACWYGIKKKEEENRKKLPSCCHRATGTALCSNLLPVDCLASVAHLLREDGVLEAGRRLYV